MLQIGNLNHYSFIQLIHLGAPILRAYLLRARFYGQRDVPLRRRPHACGWASDGALFKAGFLRLYDTYGSLLLFCYIDIYLSVSLCMLIRNREYERDAALGPVLDSG